MGRKNHKLTTRKSKSKAKNNDNELIYDASSNSDTEESTIQVPTEAHWSTMRPYGLFAISDKDGTKHRFKRGDIATILPQHKTPGESIEAHEYWVGKILEVRADAGSEDSDIIWTKVQWLYSAEDAAGIIRSLDISSFGKFERIWSDHWDFVLPHAFNEVISIPKLHIFPRPQARSSLKLNLKSLKSKSQVFRDSMSISSGSTSDDIEALVDSNVELDSQRVIGPDMFYWRYTIAVQDGKLDPQPKSKSNCICSRPYRPDDTSLQNGVMLFCPRPSCKTGYHVGCLKDAKSIWVDDDHVVVESPVSKGKTLKVGRGRGKGKGRGRPSVRGKGKGKKKEKDIDVDMDAEVEEDQEEEREWISKRALRQICTSPDTNEPINLLSLIQPPSKPSKSTPKSKKPKSGSGGIIPLLQRVYSRQFQLFQDLQSPREQQQKQQENQPSTSRRRVVSGVSAKSKHSGHSGGSIVEVEDLLIDDAGDDNDQDGNPFTNGEPGFIWGTLSHLTTTHRSSKGTTSKQIDGSPIDPKVGPITTTPTSPSKQRRTKLKLRPLTSNTLLTTLFMLPSPFPPSSPSSPLDEPFNTMDGTNLLLTLASQPLLRGGAYFPYLGPTGNINVVLGARKLVWKTLQNLSLLEFPIRSGMGMGSNNEMVEEERDAEDFRKVVKCVEGVLNNWKSRFLVGERQVVDNEDEGTSKETTQRLDPLLPPGREIEDAIIIKDGLIALGGRSIINKNDINLEDNSEDEDEDAQYEIDEDYYIEDPEIGKKRKRLTHWSRHKTKTKRKGPEGSLEMGDGSVMESDDEDMLLRIDWACPGCGGSI